MPRVISATAVPVRLGGSGLFPSAATLPSATTLPSFSVAVGVSPRPIGATVESVNTITASGA